MPDVAPKTSKEPRHMIPVKEIYEDPARGRKEYKKIPDLAENIKKLGLLHPIVVTEYTGDNPKYKYKLLAGSRRFRAVLYAGWAEVPCTLFSELSPVKQILVELEENLYRDDLTWDEECELMEKLDSTRREMAARGEIRGDHKTQLWTQEDTAKTVNRPLTTVNRLVKLGQKFKERPDLREKVKHLPLNAAARQIKHIEASEKIERQSKLGKLVLDHSLKWGAACSRPKTASKDTPEWLIKDLKDESVDMVLNDPPFGITEVENQRGSSRQEQSVYTGSLTDFDNMSHEGAAGFISELMPEVARVLKPGAYFYFFFTFELFDDLVSAVKSSGLEFSWTPIIWYKGRTVSGFTGYNYMTCYEPILFGHKPPRARRLSAPKGSLLTYPPIHANHKLHAFEKPQELLKDLIEQSTAKGQTVLDPTAGSGATLVAAKSVGRNAVGFEIDKGHFNRAQARLTL